LHENTYKASWLDPASQLIEEAEKTRRGINVSENIELFLRAWPSRMANQSEAINPVQQILAA
jgi:hypothetical protein